VSTFVETSLQLVAFHIPHNTSVSRTITTALVLMTVVCLMRDHQEYKTDDSVTMEEPKIDDKDCPKTMNSIREYLAYAIRASMDIPDGPDPSDVYATVQEEMIAQDLHGTPTYRLDNTSVWEHMANICRLRD
jgi:hypothetical protein